MANTTYTDNVTAVTADTMNDLNRLHYTILSDPADAAAVRTALAVLGTAGGTLTGLLNQSAGANIASAATVDLTAATGNSPRITGTTATSAFTMNAGQQMWLIADGAWPLTYNATTNKIVGGVSVTLTAGSLVHVSRDNSSIIQTTVFKADGSNIFPASAYAQVVTSATGVTPIPNDDTIPQITEGNEVLTLAYTRLSASSFLYLEADGYAGEEANSGSAVIAALFQDATASALVAGFADTTNSADQVFGVNFSCGHFSLKARIASGATGATTFRLRVGCDVGTVRWNGVNVGRRLGGALITSIKVTESPS